MIPLNKYIDVVRENNLKPVAIRCIKQERKFNLVAISYGKGRLYVTGHTPFSKPWLPKGGLMIFRLRGREHRKGTCQNGRCLCGHSDAGPDLYCPDSRGFFQTSARDYH